MAVITSHNLSPMDTLLCRGNFKAIDFLLCSCAAPDLSLLKHFFYSSLLCLRPAISAIPAIPATGFYSYFLLLVAATNPIHHHHPPTKLFHLLSSISLPPIAPQPQPSIHTPPISPQFLPLPWFITRACGWVIFTTFDHRKFDQTPKYLLHSCFFYTILFTSFSPNI